MDSKNCLLVTKKFSFLLLFCALSCTASSKSEEESSYDLTLQKIDQLHFQKKPKKAFFAAKELLFQLSEPKTMNAKIVRATTLDKICRICPSLIYQRYLNHDLEQIAPLFDQMDLQQQTTFFILKAHSHLYKNEDLLAENYLKKALEGYQLLLEDLSLRRSLLDSKAIAFLQVKSDIRLIQLEYAELLFKENKREKAEVLLSHAVVDKDVNYLKDRIKYLISRKDKLEHEEGLQLSHRGMTPLQFELLQTYKELYILEKYFIQKGSNEC